ncbi:ankyrin repeat domain-containing protein [Sphingomicrobium astaxanthinifaciens]|uniref:ankyrin repeat domain-containing protein n=1 Tax=Sphingomicrobium astaxanthinifaciens TaxID=1227949 RepID=UPI001FCBD75D|nr:ankyrin repeat domain-containing protein [Sphingomicrobium astaxanthinifaciens]MCJ7420444.1 ankyrin repeat domain-containing protein [Sphingomicrobium astaxanthinifaciens]
MRLSFFTILALANGVFFVQQDSIPSEEIAYLKTVKNSDGRYMQVSVDDDTTYWIEVASNKPVGRFIRFDEEQGFSTGKFSGGGARVTPGMPPLLIAVRWEDLSVLEQVLAKKPDLNWVDNNDRTVLFYALKSRDEDISETRLAIAHALISAGVDEDHEDVFGNTAYTSYEASRKSYKAWQERQRGRIEEQDRKRAAYEEERRRREAERERERLAAKAWEQEEERRKAQAERQMWAGIAGAVAQGAARIERASRPPRIPGAPTSRNERWERIREQGRQKARSEAIVEADIARARAKERRRDRVRSARKNASRDAAMRTEWFVDSPNCQFSDTYDDGRTKKTFMRQYEPAVYEVTSSSPRADYDEWRKGMLESIQRSFEQAHNLERREVASFGSYCKAETNYQASLSGALEALRDRNVQKESWLSSHRPRDDWTIFEWDPISIDLKGGKRIR